MGADGDALLLVHLQQNRGGGTDRFGAVIQRARRFEVGDAVMVDDFCDRDLADVAHALLTLIVIDENDVDVSPAELETGLQNIISAKRLDLFLFVVTDILNSDSVVVALGPRA